MRSRGPIWTSAVSTCSESMARVSPSPSTLLLSCVSRTLLGFARARTEETARAGRRYQPEGTLIRGSLWAAAEGTIREATSMASPFTGRTANKLATITGSSTSLPCMRSHRWRITDQAVGQEEEEAVMAASARRLVADTRLAPKWATLRGAASTSCKEVGAVCRANHGLIDQWRGLRKTHTGTRPSSFMSSSP